MFSTVWRRSTLLVSVTAICASMAGAAKAGTYDVAACNAATGGSVASWTLVRSDTSIAATTSCPTGNNADAGLGLYTVPDNNLLSSPGGYARWQFNAPSGTTIDGVTADYEIVRRDQHAWWGGWGIGSALIPGQACLFNSAAFDCTIGTAPGSSAWISTPGAANVNVGVGCSQLGDPWQCTHGWARGLFGSQMAAMVRSASVRISDASAPTLSVNGGGLTGGAAFVGGTQAVSYRASDNVGIKGVSFAIDGVERGSALSSCDYAQRVPCPDLSGASQSFDTSRLSDGTHTLSVTATDTANNPKTSQASSFIVDNSAPAAPINLQVNEGELWRSSPSYSVHWTNPAGQVSPIAKAYYRLCRAADPDRCEDVQSRTGDGIASLPDVRVPGEGDWLLRVYLEDQVGNVEPANVSTAAHLRYDASAPDRPSSLSVDGGERWRRDNSFDVHWTIPSDQLAPASAAHYELCDSERECRSGTARGQSLSGLAVPGRGDYSLSVWLEDEAGNADPQNFAGPIHLRFDDTDPGLAAPAGSNVWLTTPSLDEVVQLAGDETPPVSGIAGYSVTTDGSEPDDLADTGSDGIFHIADLPEGRITIKARAVSGSGVASQQVGTAVVLVDRQAPRAQVIGAPNSDAWQPGPVTVTVTAEDQSDLSGMGSGRIVYSVDGGEEHSATGESASITVSGDGSHAVTYRAVDAAGNQSESQRITFRIDATPPGRVELAEPGRWLNADDAALYVEHLSLPALPLSGLAGYSITTDGSEPDPRVDTDGDLELADLAEGETTVRARAVSGAGVASQEVASVTLHVDRTPPEVVANAPDSDTWSSSEVHLRFRASDQPGLSGMTGGRIVYSLDEADPISVEGDEAELTVAANGKHEVSYFAADAAGNRSDARVARFNIDGDAPGGAEPAGTTGWQSAPAGPYVERIRLASGVKAPASGIAGYSVTIDGSEPDSTPDTDASGEFTIDPLDEGITVIKARAISGAGVSSSEVGMAELRIDRTAPESSASGVKNDGRWSSEPAEVRLEGADRLSGMSGGHIAYSLDGAPTREIEGAVAEVEVADDGRHALVFTAVDASGNASAEKRLTVLIDRSAPEVMLERPASGSPEEISAKVMDAGSGVTGGVIEIQGGDGWRPQPTRLAGDRLVARLDTARLSRRVYEFRATATDAAGNARASSELGDGTKLTLLLGSDPEPPAMPLPVVEAPPRASAKVPAKPALKRCPRRVRRGRHGGRRCATRRHRGGEKEHHRPLGHRKHKKSRRHAG